MGLTYQNPTAIVTLTAPEGVARTSTQGNSFSVSMVGGYQEVYYADNLTLTFSGLGLQTLTANTIPIQINIGTNSGLSYTKLTLNSDNISSGRRRLGMLAYVQETSTVYQYDIPNYDNLWSAATGQTGSAAVYFGTTYTEVNSRSQAGKDFISAWTGSTIEGVNGVTREDARWKIFSGSISVSANTGLGIISGETLYTTYNTLLTPTLAMPITVGGIPSGTTVADLSGDTFVKLFDDLLFPTVQPTYTIPAISINGVTNTLAEVGTTISLSLSTTGTTNDAGRFTQLRLLRDATVLTASTSLFSGTTTPLPTQFGYADPNNPNEIFSISSGFYSESYVLPAPVSTATNTTTIYKSDGNYESGLPKLNSKGGADIRASLVRNSNAPQLSANTFNSTTYTYTNIYPYFWGVTEGLIGGNPQPAPTAAQIVGFIESGSSNAVLEFATNSVKVNYNATGKYLWVAFFENYPQKNNWFANELDKGTMGPDKFFGTPTKLPVDSPTVGAAWSNIQYNIYVTNYASDAISITFSN